MSHSIKDKIEKIAGKLNQNYINQGIFELGIGEKLPKRSEITELINVLRRIIFPGYFGSENTAYVSLDIFAGSSLAILYEKLFKQTRIALSVGRKYKNNTETEEKAEEKTLKLIEDLPLIQAMIFKDVEAQLSGDPAANSKEEVIFSYPRIFAIFIYRIAHKLYELNIPFIPRIMTEYAHSRTGIAINPGAVIGEYFFIDHGTGIVIGETIKIGNNVKIYQGVTLGALSTRKGQALTGVKRHPTIEDNVVIYANTTILGGETIVGENSIIDGNIFITKPIPANTKVSSYMPQLKYTKRKG